MRFNPLTFLISRTIAQNQGVSPAEATKLGFVGGIVPSPILGVVLVSSFARNEASGSPASASLPVLTVQVITSSSSQINLSWNQIPGATRYNVNRSTTSKGEKNIAAVSDTSFPDTGLHPDKSYYYVVEALDLSGAVIKTSDEVSAATWAKAQTVTA